MIPPGAVAASGRWSKWKRAGAKALVIAGTAAAVVVADSLFHLQPIAAERLWLAGLASGIMPLQEEGIRRLRAYPTHSTAVSLVSFIKDKNRTGDLKMAERATETLCILAGRSFGTGFSELARGHSWSSLQEGQWPEVLRQIDSWAVSALGAR